MLASSLPTLICFWAIKRVQLPEIDHTLQRPWRPAALGPGLQSLRRNRSFLRFLTAQFVFFCGLQLTVPLMPLFWVRSIHASDSIISFITGAYLLTAMTAYFLWTRAVQKRGRRWVLLTCCLGLSFYPVLTAATANPWLLVPWAAMAGLFAQVTVTEWKKVIG